jgi:phospholipase/lecithinase/hemolysin
MLLGSLTSFATTRINQVVVFGDSLSDNGNLYEYMDHQLPMSPPYYAGRFTNGPVWIELLMDKLYPVNGQARLLDYAFGGAGISVEGEETEAGFSLNNQIKNYLDANNDTTLPDTLYVVWIGANNYFNLPENQDEAVHAVINGIQKNIENLIAHGAKHVMILNVPNLSRIPAAIEYEAINELGHMSLEHNRLLAEVVDKFKKGFPDVQFIDYDVTRVMDDIIDHPARNGFINATATCSDLDDNSSNQTQLLSKSLFLSTVNRQSMNTNDKCYGYLFFDLYHPTAHAHVVMADEMYKLLKKLDISFE